MDNPPAFGPAGPGVCVFTVGIERVGRERRARGHVVGDAGLSRDDGAVADGNVPHHSDLSGQDDEVAQFG